MGIDCWVILETAPDKPEPDIVVFETEPLAVHHALCRVHDVGKSLRLTDADLDPGRTIRTLCSGRAIRCPSYRSTNPSGSPCRNRWGSKMDRRVLDVMMAAVMALWLLLAPDMMYDLFGPFGIVLAIVAIFGLTIDTIVNIMKGR